MNFLSSSFVRHHRQIRWRHRHELHDQFDRAELRLHKFWPDALAPCLKIALEHFLELLFRQIAYANISSNKPSYNCTVRICITCEHSRLLHSMVECYCFLHGSGPQKAIECKNKGMLDTAHVDLGIVLFECYEAVCLLAHEALRFCQPFLD